MSSLFKLSADYATVLNMLMDPDVDDQVVLDTCEAIEADMETKADNYAYIFKIIDADVAAIDAEVARLSARKRALENRKKSLKALLEMAMRATGNVKFKTALHSFAIQKNGGKKPLDLIAEVPEEYLTYEPKVNTELIREELEAGAELPFAVLRERGESLRIR